jgi:hypothetical protein
MERETYNSRLKTNPEDIPVGSLMRVKKHCRNNITIRNNGEYGILAKTINKGNYITHDVLFPNGTRCIYMPLNWEVVSYVR